MTFALLPQAEELADKLVTILQEYFVFFLHFLVLVFQLLYYLRISVLVLVNCHDKVVGGLEGVRSLVDVLFRGLKNLSQILRPFGHDPEDRGVLP